MSHKPYPMTEADRALVCDALHDKARTLREAAAQLEAGSSAAAQLADQAHEAERLAELIEQADLIDIWPED